MTSPLLTIPVGVAVERREGKEPLGKRVVAADLGI